MKSREANPKVSQQPVSNNGPGHITELLLEWSEGNESARDELMDLVYDELRRQARGRMRHERPNHTLQPTELVNEVFLRFVNQKKLKWQNRSQFFGLAARMMRNILVDHARRRKSAGRDALRSSISIDLPDSSSEEKAVDILAVHEALERLEKFASRQAQIVELKFFGGLTIEEASEVLHLSHATVERDWETGRTWLLRELS